MRRNAVNSIDRLVGRRIRIRRELLRMSSGEAAHRLGISEGVLAEYELGLLRADVRTLIRLTAILGVRMRYFYDGVVGVAEASPARLTAD